MNKVFLLSFVTFCFGILVVVLCIIGSAQAKKKTVMPPSCNAAVQIVPGDGAGDGPALHYQDNSDGTFTDCNTKDMWEKKLPDDDVDGNCSDPDQANRSVHCVNNTYAWSDCGVPAVNPCPPNGTLFTEFLAEVNEEALGGHSDWCIPNLKRLEMLVDSSTCNGCDGGTSASSVPGSTAAEVYWTSTTDAGFTNTAWLVFFDYGGVAASGKGQSERARAVRPCP